MDLNKICVGIMVLVAVLGIFSGNINDNIAYGANETWVKGQSNVGITGLTATIHVHIKNNAKHVQYFKISQNYTSKLNESVGWDIVQTSPKAIKMIKSTDPLGDWGWKINPGETKEVTFKIKASTAFGYIPAYISNSESVENIYWPLINEPGLFASWFWPNEIEMLNPTLDLKYWKGTFDFNLMNYDPTYTTVSGIVRGPIIPTNSKLVSATPKSNSFSDKDIYINTNTVAWDVTIAPDDVQHFQYVYVWPDPNSNSSSTGTYSYNIPKTAASSTTSSIPTAETGLPYSLFIVGGIIAAGGVVYARFMR
ncbi:hypothetical protein [Methanobacterium oryzae]|uniref:hypothetical protein n=1 Tax=Methanobacterium oryzae TaxID=69540 RepID=UPI003D24D67C